MIGEPSRLAQAAAKYAARGIPVFPLRPGAKRPLFPKCDAGPAGHEPGPDCPGFGHGFKDATDDPDQVAEWWADYPTANIGVPTGRPSGWYAVDLDLYKNPDCADQLAERGDLPDTLTSRTPRGGLHLVYQHPQGGCPGSGSTLAPHVDTRGDGGYIAVPPSTIGEGRYEWTEPCEPAPLPQWIADALTKPDLPAPYDVRLGEGDRWGERVLQGEVGRIAMSVADQNRNISLFEAACNVFEAVKGGHLPRGYAWSTLHQAATNKLLPSDEIDRTLRSAWERVGERHPQERPGPAPAAAADQEVESADRPPPAERTPRLMSYADLAALPPIRYLVADRIPEGFTVLFGEPKSGKTFVALDWALTIAAQGSPVVYCVGEGARGLRGRIDAWMRVHPQMDPTPNWNMLALGDFPRLLQPRSVRELHWDLASMDRAPVLVVIDTWARALTPGDENKQQDTQQAIAALDDVRDRHGCSVLVLHHSRSTQSGEPAPERPRGSTALDGAIDMMWRLDAPESDSAFARWWLKCTHAKDFARPRPHTFGMTQVAGSLVPTPSTPRHLGLVE